MVNRALLVVIFASLLAPADASADEWEAHPINTWVRQSPRTGQPIPRFGWEGSGAYDPQHKLWFHHSGHDGKPQGFALFAFDPATAHWEQRFPNTSPPGSCCVDGASVFDVANGRLVRLPGARLGHGWQWSRAVKLKRSAIWLFDPEQGSWMNMRPPPYAEGDNGAEVHVGTLNATATYDANHEVVLSFGGQTTRGQETNKLFAYDTYANLLAELPARSPPDARDGHAIVYDTRSDSLVVFGSQYGSDERTWFYRHVTQAWEGLDLQPHPPARKGETYSTIPRLACDTENGICLCVTWNDATGRHQTWLLDTVARKWTPANPAAEPDSSASRSRNLAYLPDLNVFLLELVAKDRGPEIWTYRYRTAPAREALPRPARVDVLIDSQGASLAWGFVPGAKKYGIYRARAEAPWRAQYTRIATTAGLRFRDGRLPGKTTWFYRVTAIDAQGREGAPSNSARTEPRVLLKPVVSVLAADKIEVAWNAHPAPDVTGYNVYRGTAVVRTVKKGSPGPWRDNDPEYAEPQVVAIRDISELGKLNPAPITTTTFVDSQVDLRKRDASAGDYRFRVVAYVVRAVNRLGIESGPSPYALSIPAEPEGLLLREKAGDAEIKWAPNPEKAIAGYHVYETADQIVVRFTAEPIRHTELHLTPIGGGLKRYSVVAVDALGQEGQPSSPVWYGRSYQGFYQGDWHQ